jgi:hypothetical protein
MCYHPRQIQKEFSSIRVRNRVKIFFIVHGFSPFNYSPQVQSASRANEKDLSAIQSIQITSE